MQNGTPQTEKEGKPLEARMASLESKLRQVENLLQSKQTGIVFRSKLQFYIKVELLTLEITIKKMLSDRCICKNDLLRYH